MTALESDTKVIVGKWVDIRDVCFLTTKSPPEMIEVETKRGIKKSPVSKVILQQPSSKIK